ncbi:PE-PGRS family protein PE_PGRS16 [Mycobacterium persicum]|uniref:PE-PGRS family protein PE_PGRS16 n=2 Tax=Mycobacterium persicum TaxID=1487726 RepID=A0AB38UPD6_9MYCO|nr:PE-PGRS family protein PE_PGRS16 [Mycobacterium persicum]
MNMSYVTAVPEALAAAARDITGIGSTLSAANSAAAVPTTGLLAAGADEVSAAIAGLFSSHAREYQTLSAQAAAFHDQFVNALTASARSYLSTEAANIAPLRNVVQGLLGMLGAPAAGNGGQSVATGAGGQGGTAVDGGSSAPGTGGGTAAVYGRDGSAAPIGTGGTGAAAVSPSSANTTTSGSGATATAAATPALTDTGASGTAAVNPTTAAPTSTASGTTALATAAATTTSTATTAASTGGTGVTATYTPTAQWNSGFTANYTITNTGTTPLTNWQLQFDLPTNESVTNLWNGQVSQSGTHYTVTPASYNGTIEPGNSVTVGFQAAQNGSYSPPTHVLVNGQPVGGDTGGTGTGTSTGGTGTGGTGTGTGTGGTGTGSTGGAGTGGTGTGSTGGTGTGSTGGTGTGGTGTGGSGITATYAPTSQWNNGFVANYTIANTGTAPVTDWQLQFDLPANESITNLWNGQVAHSGTHYTVTPQSYDATIAPGSSVTVGFQAAQTGSYAPPTNLLVNGQPVTAGTGTGGTGTGTGGTGTGGTGTGGTGTGTGTGGTLITSQYGTTTIQNAYVVQNNAWNNPGGQSINVTPTGFSIATENGSAPTNGAPLGYPSIYDGWHYGTGSPGTNLPIQLGQIQTATSSINYTYPSSGIYDASYDIWLNPTPITTGVNQQEVMIWFNHQGPIQPVGSVVGNTTIDGQNFQVWKGSNGQNNVVSYVATTPITSWNNFDVMGFIDHTQTLEPVTDSWYLTSIQAGFEPWSGSVGAGVDSFSALVNGV